MSNSQPQPLLSHLCHLGESPLWDPEKEVFCWVDIEKGELHQYTLRTDTHTTISVNQKIGAIGLCTNGHFIAALQNGFGFIDRTTHQLTMIGDPETHLPHNRFNDGKCGPDGRFWAGTMALDETPGAGNVYYLQPDFSMEKKIQGVTISNGLAWDTTRKIFYYTDTPTHTIAAYDFDWDGTIRNKRTVITVAGEEGAPDGMTIDAEGMLWIALWGGGKLARWNPHTGEKLLEIPLPVSQVTSCAFGGSQLQDLYITTASKQLGEEEKQQQPLAGAVFIVRNCGYKGVPASYFRFET